MITTTAQGLLHRRSSHLSQGRTCNAVSLPGEEFFKQTLTKFGVIYLETHQPIFSKVIKNDTCDIKHFVICIKDIFKQHSWATSVGVSMSVCGNTTIYGLLGRVPSPTSWPTLLLLVPCCLPGKDNPDPWTPGAMQQPPCNLAVDDVEAVNDKSIHGNFHLL